jgi:crotonobetainyl-CoA:carnitine CoA-transferase CaiB-like acyl-CoA transferase
LARAAATLLRPSSGSNATTLRQRRRREEKPMLEVMRGVRVLEVAQFWFVPAAGAVLADWGADVIKLEHPTHGDGQRGLATSGVTMELSGVDFLVQQPNRGKRSVGVDIATPAGRELLYQLAERCDVFLTNFLPDARRKLGIEVDQIRARNPRIIYVRGHGHGDSGPERELGGYDATSFWTRGGIAAALTTPEMSEPVSQRAAFGDGIGGMTLAGGIAAALFHRERTGEAKVVDVSLLSTAMWVMSPDIVASKLLPEGVPQLPWAPRKTRFNPVVNSYKTKDERWLILVHLQADRHWADLCRRIGRPGLSDDARFKDGRARFENRAACIAELDAAFATKTLAEWRVAFEGMEGPWAPMQTPRELHEDRQVAENGYLQEVDGGRRGRFTLVRSPVQFDAQRAELRRGPEMGEHTDEVLMETLGLTIEQLLALKASGVIH